MRRWLLSLSLFAVVFGGCCGRRCNPCNRTRPCAPGEGFVPCTAFELIHDNPTDRKSRVWYLGDILRLSALHNDVNHDAVCNAVAVYLQDRRFLAQGAVGMGCVPPNSNFGCILSAHVEASRAEPNWNFVLNHLMDGQ
jgi:hypothetical protein